MKISTTIIVLAAAIAASVHAQSPGATAPSSLLAPHRIIVPCEGPRGAVVEFDVALADSRDTNTTIECRPASGSVFAVGTNMVTCVGMDAAGGQISTAFPVIVLGGCATDDCIELDVPGNIEARCDSAKGATVQFDVTARDRCTGGTVNVTCVPPAGSIFSVGLTRVVCTATSGDRQASAGFIVEVTDGTPPEIQCPTNMIVEAQSPLGALVEYEVTAKDEIARQLRVRCSPPSGSAFAIGETRVFCQAGDGNGNSSSCAFIVKVNPAQPLRITRLEGGQVELRWTGDAVLQGTEVLAQDPNWQEIPGLPQIDGWDRVVHLPALARQHFFRTRPLPLLPPADRDNDGVPDSRDRCPDTPAGLKVDEHGCSVLELVAKPEGVLGPEREALANTVSEIQLTGVFSNLAERLQTQLAASNNPALFLRSRELAGAFQAQSNLVFELRRAVLEFPRAMAVRIAELQHAATPLDAAHADVRPEDFEILRLEGIQTGLGDSLSQSEQTLTTLSNLVQAASFAQPPERVRIASFDNEYGTAQLEDGRRLLLPKIESQGPPPIDQIPGIFGTGEFVELEAAQLPDGTLFGLDLQQIEVSANPNLKLDPTCLRLRIVPADPALPTFDFGTRHHLRGYKWGESEASGLHYLEFGMALAVEKVNSFEPPGYTHWLYIAYDDDNDGNYSLLTASLDENSKPLVLRSADLPKSKVFPIRVYEYRHKPLGMIEQLSMQSYLVQINDYGSYAQAKYNRTVFELEDWPNESRFQAAHVVDVERQSPLTLQSLAQQTFTAQGYKVSGQSSSYPNVQDIYLNQSFAVRIQDPNNEMLFAHPNEVGRGLAGPTISGFNWGRPFTYRVTLPSIVRDRLHDCTGGVPDSYYRIPFLGPLTPGQYGAWEVSQGNFGKFTHKGTARYAFDFLAKEGRPVLAARGGVVFDVQTAGSKSCWDPDFDDGDDIDGGCTGCSGDKSPNSVTIRHQDGTFGVYMHFMKNGVSVSKGQRVYRGDGIGKVGNTGCSTEAHLHFEVRKPDGSDTIPIRFECYDEDGYFRGCYLPPHDSEGASTNKPFWWPL